MKTWSELQNFYNNSLRLNLDQLEKKRKEIFHHLFLVAAIIVAVLAISTVLIYASRLEITLLVFPLAGAIAAAVVSFRIFTRDYPQEFKDKIIPPLIKFINENLSYNHQRGVAEVFFAESEIFPLKTRKFTAADLVWGHLKGVAVDFSFIEAEFAPGGSYPSFKGFFFTANSQKKCFSNVTAVLPNTIEMLFGRKAPLFQSWYMSRGQRTKFNDPDFDRGNFVYSDNQVEPHHIVSQNMRKRIVQFRKETSKPVYLSFVGNRVFLAIPTKGAIFPRTIFDKIYNYAGLKKYIEDIKFAFELTLEVIGPLS